jgi:hypothetical protein
MSHPAEDASLAQKGHVQLSSSTSSTSETLAATPKAIKTVSDNVRKGDEQTDFKVYKNNKDTNGIFTNIQFKRAEGTLAIDSTLSGGASPQYTTRTIKYYGLDGTTVEKTTPRTLTYDTDGVLISEV